MSATLRLAGRDFAGFRNALARQAEAFEQQPLTLDGSWLDLPDLERLLLHERAAGGGELDLVLAVTDWLPELIAEGQLLPLDDLLADAPPEGWPDAYAPSLLDLQRDGAGRLHALPYHDGPTMLIYRDDLFTDRIERARFVARHGYQLAPPQTWEQFLDVARHFTRPEAGLWGTVLAGLPDGHNNVYDFLIQLWSRGGELLDAAGRPAFDSPAGAEALSFLRDLWQVHGVVDPAAHGWDTLASGASFAAGEAAMMVNWAGLAAMTTERTAGRIACAPPPGGVALNVYWTIGIAAGSRQPELAWEFLRHLASPAMDLVTAEEGATATRRSTWADPRAQAIAPYYGALEQAHAGARTLPALPQYPAVNERLNVMVERAVGGDMSVADALRAGAAEAAAALGTGTGTDVAAETGAR